MNQELVGTKIDFNRRGFRTNLEFSRACNLHVTFFPIPKLGGQTTVRSVIESKIL